MLNRSRHSSTPSLIFYSKGAWGPGRESNHQRYERLNIPKSESVLRQVDPDENVNGRRGTLRSQKRANPDSRDEEKDDELKFEENLRVSFTV